MKRVLLLLISFLFLFSSPCFTVFAVQLPRIISSEKRFRIYIYNPNDVYKYIGHYMYQTYIEFEEGETIQTITMGDTTAWQMTALGNKLFLKPVLPYPETNMTILTNKRIYHFELTAVEGATVSTEDVLFYVKFMYPDEEDKTIVTFKARTTRDDAPDLRNPKKYNFNYEFSGSENIAPLKVFDDGEFTYMQFPEKNVAIPAVFSVNNLGYESLVNFRVVDQYLVIEQVGTQFTLRSGNDIVCVYNNSLYKYKNY